MYEPFLTFPRIVLFHDTRSNDSRSSDARFMHKLCLSLNVNVMNERAQATSHRKVERFHWTIQIKLDSFPLKQKSDKIEHSLFPPMYIPF